MGRVRLDAFAVVASVLATVMVIVYSTVTREQGGEPAAWAVAALVGGAAAAAYGAVRTVPYRRSALVLAGLVLFAMGVLAILSIGLPILLAGVLSLAAAVRRGGRGRPDGRHSTEPPHDRDGDGGVAGTRPRSPARQPDSWVLP